MPSRPPFPARLAALLAALSLLAPVLADPPAPRRICSVSLAGDELLALLVPPERVACVSRYADDPDLAACAGRWPREIPRLGATLEAVLARRPDLVVAAPWNRADFLPSPGGAGPGRSIIFSTKRRLRGIDDPP